MERKVGACLLPLEETHFDIAAGQGGMTAVVLRMHTRTGL